MSLINDMLRDLSKQKKADLPSIRDPMNRILSSEGRLPERTFKKVIPRLILWASLLSMLFLIKNLYFLKVHKTSAERSTVPLTSVLKESKQERKSAPESAPLPQLSVHEIGRLREIYEKPLPQIKQAPQPVASFHKVYAKAPPADLYQKALQAASLGDSKKAIFYLNSILMHDPKNLKARQSLATLLLAEGKWEEATQVLHQGLALFPHDITLIELKARALWALGDLGSALALLQSETPKVDEHPEYYATLAALYEKTHDLKKAGEIYQLLLRVEPNNGMYWFGLALAEEAQDENNQAMIAYQNALNDPNIKKELQVYALARLQALKGENSP